VGRKPILSETGICQLEVPHERASIDFPKIGTRISGLHIRTCKRRREKRASQAHDDALRIKRESKATVRVYTSVRELTPQFYGT
jgi:hypothetical protein